MTTMKIITIPHTEGDYWTGTTHLECACGGIIVWAEAGYVPGARACRRCLTLYMVRGNGPDRRVHPQVHGVQGPVDYVPGDEGQTPHQVPVDLYPNFHSMKLHRTLFFDVLDTYIAGLERVIPDVDQVAIKTHLIERAELCRIADLDAEIRRELARRYHHSLKHGTMVLSFHPGSGANKANPIAVFRRGGEIVIQSSHSRLDPMDVVMAEGEQIDHIDDYNRDGGLTTYALDRLAAIRDAE